MSDPKEDARFEKPESIRCAASPSCEERCTKRLMYCEHCQSYNCPREMEELFICHDCYNKQLEEETNND